MNRKITIQLKAAFLLLVFGLNTIVGFACSLGLNMSFNTSHHKEDVTATTIHVHADGKKHVHTKTTAKPAVHVHAGCKKHQHDSGPLKQHPEEKETPKKDKEGCCNDDVLKFQNLDKILNSNTKLSITPPALIAILSSFLSINIFKVPEAPLQFYTERYLFPPPPDIRISIHRFQI